MLNDKITKSIAKYMRQHSNDILSTKRRTGHFNPHDMDNPKTKALKSLKLKFK